MILEQVRNVVENSLKRNATQSVQKNLMYLNRNIFIYVSTTFISKFEILAIRYLQI